ncbi:MAG: hypothetical protein WC889_12645 [Myxococcota bacterium]|jgi:hypothetical protein
MKSMQIACLAAMSIIAAPSVGAQEPVAPAKLRVAVTVLNAGANAVGAQVLQTLVCSELGAGKVYDIFCPEDTDTLIKNQVMRMELGACQDGDCGQAGKKMFVADITVAPSLLPVREGSGDCNFVLIATREPSGDMLGRASRQVACDPGKSIDTVRPLAKELLAAMAKALASAPAKKPEPAKTDAGQPASPAGK